MIVSKFHVPISHYFPKIASSKNVTVEAGWAESGQFIVLNDLAGPNFSIKIDFIFLRFLLKILQVFDFRRNDLCMNVNKNFVSFAHS